MVISDGIIAVSDSVNETDIRLDSLDTIEIFPIGDG
jgi:hypothetical protein